MFANFHFLVCSMKSGLQVSPFFRAQPDFFLSFSGRCVHVVFLNKKTMIQQQTETLFAACVSLPSLLALTIPPRQINCNAKIGKGKYRSELFYAAAAAAVAVVE